MNLPHEKENRDVIPNWRSFNITSDLGELSKLRNRTEILFNLDSLKLDWENEKSIGVAADLLNAHYISNQEADKTILEATDFIIDSSKPSKLLLELSNSVKQHKKEVVQEIQNNDEDKKIFLISQIKLLIENTARNQIAIYKKLTIKNARNPINWVELSRLYSIEGEKNKSEKCILTALFLAPNNRFILRSATRLFIENEKPEMAIYFLRKSTTTAIDPWLTSAHIAVSSSLEKFSPFIKNAIRQRDSNKFTSFDLTELNSSLGTLELNNGSFKKARTYFNDSLKLPNDNSLAQFQFILNQDKRLNGVVNNNSVNVKNNFEALALKYRDEGVWNKSIENSLKWFLDMPYSAEPAIFSSYLLCTVTGDFETAVTICELALKINPAGTALFNNLIYSLLHLDRIKEAEKYLKIYNFYFKENPNSFAKEFGITALATNALFLIKINEVDEGIKLYNEAISLAKKANIKYYTYSAKLNMAKELSQIKHPDATEMEKEILTLKLEEFKDLEEFRRRNFSIKL